MNLLTTLYFKISTMREREIFLSKCSCRGGHYNTCSCFISYYVQYGFFPEPWDQFQFSSMKIQIYFCFTQIGMRGDTFVSLLFLDLILSAVCLNFTNFLVMRIDINRCSAKDELLLHSSCQWGLTQYTLGVFTPTLILKKQNIEYLI